jgi:hypothetical protein
MNFAHKKTIEMEYFRKHCNSDYKSKVEVQPDYIT